MRKINSYKTLEEKRKKNTLILSIFMLVILVGGTAGYAFISNPSSQFSNENKESSNENGGFQGNKWVMKIDGVEMSFSHAPESTKEIQVNTIASLSTFRGAPVYIDSDNEAIFLEIASVLRFYTNRIQKACYGPCEEDLPEKDCDDNLIVWRDSSQNSVSAEKKCIFIEGDLRAVDAFLYHTLGVPR